MTNVTTLPLLTPACDCDGNNSNLFQKNQWQQWQRHSELLQGPSPAVQTSHNNHHLQLSTAPVFSDTRISSQFQQEWEGIVHFLRPTLTFLPALHVWGGSGFPSHDCLEGTGEFYLCDRCIEGTSSVTDTTPCKDQTGEGSTFPVSQQEVARTFP